MIKKQNNLLIVIIMVSIFILIFGAYYFESFSGHSTKTTVKTAMSNAIPDSSTAQVVVYVMPAEGGQSG